MAHVDEGTLHALLDGALRAMEPERADEVEAHLFTCADCRALAADAAALRGRAGGILGVLEPDADPDFDEVVARAGTLAAGAGAGGARDPGTAARLRLRSARRVRGLAWAATIVIALGTGYLIRDRLVPEREMRFESGADRVERAEAASPPREEAGPGSGIESGAESATGPVVRPAPAFAPATPDAGELATTAEDAGPAEAAADAVPGRALGPAPVLELATRDPVEGPLGRAVVPGTAGEATVAQAAALLGAPVLVLPEADVLTVGIEGEGADAVVTTRQRLATGTEIVVTQKRTDAPLGVPAPEPAYGGVAEGQRAAERRALLSDRIAVTSQAAPALAAPAPTGAALAEGPAIATVRVIVDGAELVLAGPLPEETLRLLAVGARPAP